MDVIVGDQLPQVQFTFMLTPEPNLGFETRLALGVGVNPGQGIYLSENYP